MRVPNPFSPTQIFVKRSFKLVWALAALASTVTFLGNAELCLAEPPPAPRDVIVVTLDTTRIDRLSVYGAPRVTSPILEKLARGGVVYDRAYSTSSWTLPSHVSMFTGRMPRAHGAHNDAAGTANLSQQVENQDLGELRVNALGPAQVTLAEVLADNGYATGAFVGGPWLAPRFGALQGFQTVDANIVNFGGRPANQVTDRALAWTATLTKDQPMFLFLNYFDAHWPYTPPIGLRALVRGETAESSWDAYDGEIRFADIQLGLLLKGLAKIGRADSAVVIVVGDHGHLFDEHGVTGHADWLWEELIRVPLVVRDPGAANAGERSSELVSVMDLPAIVSKAVGIPLPPTFHSTLPGNRKEILTEVYRQKLSVRLKGSALDRDLLAILRPPWKMILDSRGGAELYDVYADSGETKDRADEFVATVSGLREALDTWRERTPRPEPKTAVVDPSTREWLRELGYVE
ncbi:MAG: arylsulfatase A-like enzyme [Hyphomicrobiaceae bacterium]